MIIYKICLWRQILYLLFVESKTLYLVKTVSPFFRACYNKILLLNMGNLRKRVEEVRSAAPPLALAIIS